MRSFLAKDKGELIGAVEREHRCVIEIKETTEKQQDDEDDSDELSSLSDYEEDVDEDDETIGTPEGKKVIWKLGNIEEEEADILVCSVGSNLNLSIGAIARAMSQLAGPALQDALIKATANNHLRPGEVVHTIPGNLPCNHAVFLCVLPILQTLLWKCFDEASQLGWCSIALPLIGTGTLNFPHDVAVQVMVDEAIRHSNTYPNSPIEEFRFIVHGEDKEGISAFEEKFRHFKEENQRRCLVPRMPQTGHTNRRRKETPIFPGPRCTKVLIGDVAVEVVKGDITKESSDGIISLVREDLQMKHGNLSAAIANASGNAVQEELTAKFPHPSGSAVTTSAGDMAAKCIIHMVVASGNKRHLLKCVQAALKEAHSLDLKSVFHSSYW
ncbi:positive regulation of interleukin-4-mediated signaling pathway [Desmophyllum pertusum]|uniref:Positive regulation of interleukin-4-mediated signaling pathway n=1 Tax=Desmophyllum pertusum TaxID=174260 RepID=A0A9W9ZJ00_9CNID|nr:positive regulation of interleukin-4-mediated signaling pathway [Desmophyllum pertusum]